MSSSDELAAALARVAELEDGIRELADEWFHMSRDEGKTLITVTEAHRRIYALLGEADQTGASDG